MTMHTISTYFHGGWRGREKKQEQHGWDGRELEGKENGKDTVKVSVGAWGGGDEKVGMALLGWDSLLQGGIQS